MLSQGKINKIIRFISVVEVLGVCFIIFMAFIFQFLWSDLPCPLCLLQRLGLLGIALGLLFNIRYHVRPSHYATALLSALFTAFVALRQIALHISDPLGYGGTLFGMHMYTWCFVICMVAIIYLTLAMSFPLQYQLKKDDSEIVNSPSKPLRVCVHVVFLLLITLVAANIISIVLECGLSECPDNPIKYMVFSDL